MKVTTRRLVLIPSAMPMAQAEMADRTQFAELLGARVPDNWPPESAADALPWFLQQLEADPANFGWLAWYVINEEQLIAGIGFKGKPSADGTVEVGYSVLPQFQGQGFAREMLAGIVDWAFSHTEVARILADTMPTNTPSMRMLADQGFRLLGPGSEEGSQMFELARTSFLKR